MAGTCQYSNIFRWNAIFFCEVLRYDQIVIGYDSFYSSNDEFIPYPRFQLLQVSFEIGGGGDKYQRIRLFYYIVDIRAEVDALHVEFDARQVGRVMAQSFKIGYTIISSHIPVNRLSLSKYHFCNGCSPASSAHYGYLSG